MSTTQNITSCVFAELIREVISSLKGKAVLHPEYQASYYVAAQELIRIERRHFDLCAVCQAAEAQEAA